VVPLDVPVDDPVELPAELVPVLLAAVDPVDVPGGRPVELPVELAAALEVGPVPVAAPELAVVPLETWVWRQQPARLATSKPARPTNARDAADATEQD